MNIRCEKVGHADRNGAFAALRSAKGAGRLKGQVKVYQCDVCRLWHFGHRP